ncbi:Uncharacterised protein [Mycobacteroides abscessus subsp. abscessus]|nr:Uncharacterised protein [Mycobacteroides abscessus subsp. abscessus]
MLCGASTEAAMVPTSSLEVRAERTAKAMRCGKLCGVTHSGTVSLNSHRYMPNSGPRRTTCLRMADRSV